MKPLISVIVPAYNAEKFLEFCLNSILQQTYENLEIIVVNDGSTDGTAKLMKLFAERDNRIKTHHKPNSGVSDARNMGMQIAKGDFIGFVDADDEILPAMFETLYKNLQKNAADIAHSSFEIVMPEQTKIFGGTGKKLRQNRNEALASLLRGNLFEPSACTKLYSRKVLDNVFFETSIKFNEDLLFNAKAFKNAHKIIFQDVILYRYRFNLESASKASSRYEIQKNIISAAAIRRDKLLGIGIDDEVNHFYYGKLITVLQSLQNEGERNSVLSKQIRAGLQKSLDSGLSVRLLFLKYSLLYMPFLFSVSKWAYNLTFGRNKKWDLN